MPEGSTIEKFRIDAGLIYEEALDILVSKQIDYGPNNIQLSPFGPMVGLLVRLQDKLSRAANLTTNNIEPNHESIRDTFLDILNYGAIGMMLVDDTFPKAETKRGVEWNW